MGWTVSSAAARARAALRGDGRAGAAGSADGAGEGADGDQVREDDAPRGDLFDRALVRALGRVTAADAKALRAAQDQILEPGVVSRAVASGAPLPAIAALAAAWDGLDPVARALVTAPLAGGGERTVPGPLAWGTTRAVQVDSTTCGAAVMAVMLLVGDPFVGLWLATGRTLAGYVPAEVIHVAAEGHPAASVTDRWHALQRVLHAATTASSLGPVPWPRSLGTPPWKLDDRTRFAGLRFRGTAPDDSTPELLAPTLAHARRALADGIPVPVFVSGDSSLGLTTVIPRHVVLLVASTPAGFLVYEPGAGVILPIDDADLHPRSGRLAALGNWSRVAWFVMPVRARRG